MSRPLYADENAKLLNKKINALYEKFKDTEIGQYFENAMQSFASLEELVSDVCKRDSNGLMPIIDANRKQNLGNIYLAAYNSIKGVSDQLDVSDEDVSEVQDIMSYLVWSINALNTADPKVEQNLFEILEAKDDKQIVLKSEEYSSAGAAQSSRIPVEYTDSQGKTVKGFFTPETKIDSMGNVKKFFESYSETSPAFSVALLDFWNKFQQAKKESYLRRKGTIEGYDSNLAAVHLLVELGHVDLENSMFNRFLSHDDDNDFGLRLAILYQQYADQDYNLLQGDFFMGFKRCGKGLSKALNHASFYLGQLGAREGRNIDRRNSAMSDVAALLGVPNLICHSSDMQLNVGGKMINGTFMEDAKGYDILHMPEDCPAYKTKQKNINGYKSIFDLHVLDYICGNIDRHAANVLYNYDDQGQFLGVQGIDNDCAFGTQEYTDGIGINRLLAPEQMKIITRSMYDKVMNLKDEALEFALKDKNLGKEEVTAAVNRLHHLQGVLSTDKILVADNDYFSEGTTKDVSPSFFHDNSSTYCALTIVKGIEENGADFDYLGMGNAIAKNQAETLSFSGRLYNKARKDETLRMAQRMLDIPWYIRWFKPTSAIVNKLAIVGKHSLDNENKSLSRVDAAGLEKTMKSISELAGQFIEANQNSTKQSYVDAVSAMREVQDYCKKQSTVLDNVRKEYNKQVTKSVTSNAKDLASAKKDFASYEEIESRLYQHDSKGNILYKAKLDKNNNPVYKHTNYRDKVTGEIKTQYILDKKNGNKIPEYDKKHPLVKNIENKDQAAEFGRIIKEVNGLIASNDESTISFGKTLLKDALAELRRSNMTEQSGLTKADIETALANIKRGYQAEGRKEQTAEQIKEEQEIKAQAQGLSF